MNKMIQSTLQCYYKGLFLKYMLANVFVWLHVFHCIPMALVSLLFCFLYSKGHIQNKITTIPAILYNPTVYV